MTGVVVRAFGYHTMSSLIVRCFLQWDVLGGAGLLGARHGLVQQQQQPYVAVFWELATKSNGRSGACLLAMGSCIHWCCFVITDGVVSTNGADSGKSSGCGNGSIRTGGCEVQSIGLWCRSPLVLFVGGWAMGDEPMKTLGSALGAFGWDYLPTGPFGVVAALGARTGAVNDDTWPGECWRWKSCCSRKERWACIQSLKVPSVCWPRKMQHQWRRRPNFVQCLQKGSHSKHPKHFPQRVQSLLVPETTDNASILVGLYFYYNSSDSSSCKTGLLWGRLWIRAILATPEFLRALVPPAWAMQQERISSRSSFPCTYIAINLDEKHKDGDEFRLL
jgi:hypothetical protein